MCTLEVAPELTDRHLKPSFPAARGARARPGPPGHRQMRMLEKSTGLSVAAAAEPGREAGALASPTVAPAQRNSLDAALRLAGGLGSSSRLSPRPPVMPVDCS